MKIPVGFGVGGYHKLHWIIELKQNLYTLNGAGLTWFYHLKVGMEYRGFVEYNVDP